MNKDIWEGIYKTFKEVPVVGKGHDSDQWIKSQKAKLLESLEKLKLGKTVPEIIAYRSTLLPVLAASINSKSDKIRILDFGGGLGLTYLQVISALVNSENIEYHVVETKRICETSEQFFHNDKRIHFHSSLPNKLKELDIVHISSALQYIENWNALIRKLADYQPEYFLFVDLPAGDIPTYATAQNYYESNIPYWFFNIEDLINMMCSVNFKLCLKSTFIGTILGQEQKLPQNNFPKENRLGHACNLLFRRGKTHD